MFSTRKVALLALAGLVAAFLAGCAGVKTYPNDLPKNLQIRPKTSSGSFFHVVKSAVHVYEVDGGCNPTYLGSVQLDDASLAVGLPVNRRLYLEFAFEKRALLYDKTAQAAYGLLLRTEAGREYAADMTYNDDMYKVQVWEANKRGEKRRVEAKRLNSCVPEA